MGENPEWENRVCGKRKEQLVRGRPGENELVVCGFMEEDLGSSSFLVFLFFWMRSGCFCEQRGFAVSHRGVSKNKRAFAKRRSYLVSNELFPEKSKN